MHSQYETSIRSTHADISQVATRRDPAARGYVTPPGYVALMASYVD